MRQLSDRALNYIHNLKRNKDSVTDREQIEKYFQSQEIPIFEAVINYAISYSGLTFQTKAKKSDSFFSFLLSSQDIKLDRQFQYEKLGDNFLFYCGDHATAQFHFYIDQQGRFCTKSNEVPNILSSSFELQVEQYAYKDTIVTWSEDSRYHNINSSDALQTMLTSRFDIVQECTDDYNCWFLNDNIIIQKGIWLHEPSFYLHFYGKTNSFLNEFISECEKTEIIRLS